MRNIIDIINESKRDLFDIDDHSKIGKYTSGRTTVDRRKLTDDELKSLQTIFKYVGNNNDIIREIINIINLKGIYPDWVDDLKYILKIYPADIPNAFKSLNGSPGFRGIPFKDYESTQSRFRDIKKRNKSQKFDTDILNEYVKLFNMRDLTRDEIEYLEEIYTHTNYSMEQIISILFIIGSKNIKPKWVELAKQNSVNYYYIYNEMRNFKNDINSLFQYITSNPIQPSNYNGNQPMNVPNHADPYKKMPWHKNNTYWGD